MLPMSGEVPETMGKLLYPFENVRAVHPAALFMHSYADVALEARAIGLHVHLPVDEHVPKRQPLATVNE